jgi:hypothetical protein
MRLKLGLASLMIALIAACLLFVMKDRVNRLDGELRQLRGVVSIERARLHRLQAEWAVLSQPTRLARLAAVHLQLRPAHPTQIMTVADVPRRAELALHQHQLQALLPSGAEVPLRLKPYRLPLPLISMAEAQRHGP